MFTDSAISDNLFGNYTGFSPCYVGITKIYMSYYNRLTYRFSVLTNSKLIYDYCASLRTSRNVSIKLIDYETGSCSLFSIDRFELLMFKDVVFEFNALIDYPIIRDIIRKTETMSDCQLIHAKIKLHENDLCVFSVVI